MKPPRVLVASDNVDDARLVRDLLGAEFEAVEISTDASRAAEVFDRVQPDVLLLAFDRLEKAERHCLVLKRASAAARRVAHRSLVLCTREELHDAYARCRSGEFDDYVLFWPMNHDAPRLLMAVHQAIRFSGESDGVTRGDFAAQVRPLATLESNIDGLTAAGEDGLRQASLLVDDIRTELDNALCGLVAEAAGAGDVALRRAGAPEAATSAESKRLHQELVLPRLRQIGRQLASARQALQERKAALASHLAANRRLQALAERVATRVDVVDDDGLLCKTIARALADVRIDTRCCKSAQQALRMLRQSRSDIVLMDIDLPDMDGIALIRQVRELPGYGSVPIVMITGHSDKQMVVDSIAAGAAGFLVKPVTREKLYAQVNALLGWPVARALPPVR